MPITADVGREFRQTLLDGRTIQARLTFGDFARAEIANGTNFLTAIATEGDISLTDLAMLCYQAATRTDQFRGTFDEWLMAIDGFPDIEKETDEENEAAPPAPFPQVAQGAS